MKFFLLLLICLSPGWTQPLLRQSFVQQLPKSALSLPVRPKVWLVSVGGVDEPTVKLSLETLGDNYFRLATVELEKNPRSHQVQAEFGNPINCGTLKSPMMSVPLKLTWSRPGSSRTSLWNVTAGGCQKRLLNPGSTTNQPG